MYDVDWIDVVIGAPYEKDGAGAVYIYHGNKAGIGAQYAQRITSQEMGYNLRGFGCALDSDKDIDENGYTGNVDDKKTYQYGYFVGHSK